MTSRQPVPGMRVLAVAVLLLLSPAAQAYLDPSTGSLILSAIVGLLATIGLAIKTWWYKIRSLFRRDAPGAEAPADRTAGGAGRSGNDGSAGR